MAVDVVSELTIRYGENFLIQITNDDVGANTINSSRLDRAIKDVKARLYRHTGRKFETDIRSIEDEEYLDWQVGAVCTLVIWSLEGFQLGQTLDADARYKAWVTEVERERDRNETLEPMTNAPVTQLDPHPPTGDVFPAFAESGFDDFVPDNDGYGGGNDLDKGSRNE